MLIFTDVHSGDELFSDSYTHDIVNDGFFIEAEGSWKTVGEVDVDIGANPSAEGGGDDEGVSGDEKKVVDIIDAFRLQETGYDKKGLSAYLKAWVQKTLKYLTDNRPDEVDAFKKTAPAAVKELIGKVKELQFFTGESMDPEATMVFAYYKEGAGNPTFLFPKYALKEVKC